jgi:spoIIIJ-associated protein
MEWVETTGKTVEEALDAALDQLGVDAADAEYEVLEEPKTGLFGRLRTEARVRARVRPTTPRAKEERRPRARKATGSTRPAAASPTVDGSSDDAADATNDEPPAPSRAPRAAAKAKPRTPKAKTTTVERESQVSDTEQEVPIAEQGEVAATFVRGVIERFGATTATVEPHLIDDETVEIRVEGDDLGLLIGPKGVALQSLQELTRTVVQRQTGARSGRVLVDVSGYRQRRKEALERFARKIADDVLGSGTRVVLEPMNPSDRKVIHDTMNDIEGVTTSSEGEEPRRRVVVSPA